MSKDLPRVVSEGNYQRVLLGKTLLASIWQCAFASLRCEPAFAQFDPVPPKGIEVASTIDTNFLNFLSISNFCRINCAES
ncbi:MAG: hypothetical protein ACLFSQ_12280, partial [Candidatus Zixiibacteriota bacterium]